MHALDPAQKYSKKKGQRPVRERSGKCESIDLLTSTIDALARLGSRVLRMQGHTQQHKLARISSWQMDVIDCMHDGSQPDGEKRGNFCA
jgi:hypothetical protein